MALISRNRFIIMIKKGGVIAIIAFDVPKKMVDTIAKLQYFPNCKSNHRREIAKNNSKLINLLKLLYIFM